jgi:hypothetical protein
MDRLPARHDPATVMQFKRAKREDIVGILDVQAVTFIDNLEDGRDNAR